MRHSAELGTGMTQDLLMSLRAETYLTCTSLSTNFNNETEAEDNQMESGVSLGDHDSSVE